MVTAMVCVVGKRGRISDVMEGMVTAVAVLWVTWEVDVDVINGQGGRFLPLERYVVNFDTGEESN